MHEISVQNSTILIVNENIEGNKLIYDILQNKGYKLIITENGEEGFSLTYKMKIDLIFLGKITIEGFDTVEILKRIKSNPETKKIPVVIIVEEGEREFGIEAITNGAIDYFMKPYNEVEFSAKVKNFISLKLLSESFARAIKLEEEKKVKTQELETFKAFVVTANHEFNQPLSIIKGNMDLLSMLHPNFAEENSKYFSKINTSISRVTKILNRLKEMDEPEYVEYTEAINMINIGNIDKSFIGY